jgi:aryl-alcohol dehydrogenase-like predicted oxidoreductase
MTFGEDWGWGSSKDESRKIYDAYREAGGNFIDTANVYTNGVSETFLGEFLQGHRDSVVLATKFTNAMPGNDANAAGNHRKSMFTAVEGSLRRLKTDYIDLYWLHIWDQITPLEEVARGFEDLVRQGKVLYAGVSDAPAWWIARFNTIAELRGWAPFIGLQIEYSLAERTPERELLPMAAALGIGVTAWSPLAGGVLTGKYQGAAPQDARLSNESMQQFRPDPQRTERIVTTLKSVATQIGVSPAQVALAWLRYRPQPVIPIIGARKFGQFQDNMASVDVQLGPDHLKQLDESSRVELGFPHDFFKRERVKAIVYGGMRDKLII